MNFHVISFALILLITVTLSTPKPAKETRHVKKSLWKLEQSDKKLEAELNKGEGEALTFNVLHGVKPAAAASDQSDASTPRHHFTLPKKLGEMGHRLHRPFTAETTQSDYDAIVDDDSNDDASQSEIQDGDDSDESDDVSDSASDSASKDDASNGDKSDDVTNDNDDDQSSDDSDSEASDEAVAAETDDAVVMETVTPTSNVEDTEASIGDIEILKGGKKGDKKKAGKGKTTVSEVGQTNEAATTTLSPTAMPAKKRRLARVLSSNNNRRRMVRMR